jgi:hypothetical protein
MRSAHGGIGAAIRHYGEVHFRDARQQNIAAVQSH